MVNNRYEAEKKAKYHAEHKEKIATNEAKVPLAVNLTNGALADGAAALLLPPGRSGKQRARLRCLGLRCCAGGAQSIHPHPHALRRRSKCSTRRPIRWARSAALPISQRGLNPKL